MGTFIGVVGVLGGALMVVLGMSTGLGALAIAGVAVVLLAFALSSLLSHVAALAKTEREVLEELRNLRRDLAQRA